MAQIKCQECGQPYNNELASCPNCGFPTSKTSESSLKGVSETVAGTKGLSQNLQPAFTQVLTGILQILLIPYNLWVKAVERLALSCNNRSLSLAHIDTPWPFLSFLKRLLLEFLFDMATFLAYILGPLLAIWRFFSYLSRWGDYEGAFQYAAEGFLAVLLVIYLLPVLFAICRDLFQLLLLPLRKFLNWCLKPAQTFDLNIRKKDGFIE
ncbi:MAG: hypothetical protein IJ816_03110 [Alloprevotella sp.]|nr:hypothetical protein [Alloprevotella sp.]